MPAPPRMAATCLGVSLPGRVAKGASRPVRPAGTRGGGAAIANAPGSRMHPLEESPSLPLSQA